MHRYAYQPRNAAFDPVTDEITHELHLQIDQAEIEVNCRHIAKAVADHFVDDAPWDGWQMEVSVLIEGAKWWDIRRVPFAGLLDP